MSCIRPLLQFSRTPWGLTLEVTQPEEVGMYMSFCALVVGIGCALAVE
jgi:hypothetical protein